mmetsp:Transcript_114426/g.255412  ORF Transcript_114426/g.255412 Transcript_114426/m.255412 type:complete len:321 (-) Transcript_114426:263-1225(-)
MLKPPPFPPPFGTPLSSLGGGCDGGTAGAPSSPEASSPSTQKGSASRPSSRSSASSSTSSSGNAAVSLGASSTISCFTIASGVRCRVGSNGGSACDRPVAHGNRRKVGRSLACVCPSSASSSPSTAKDNASAGRAASASSSSASSSCCASTPNGGCAGSSAALGLSGSVGGAPRVGSNGAKGRDRFAIHGCGATPGVVVGGGRRGAGGRGLGGVTAGGGGRKQLVCCGGPCAFIWSGRPSGRGAGRAGRPKGRGAGRGGRPGAGGATEVAWTCTPRGSAATGPPGPLPRPFEAASDTPGRTSGPPALLAEASSLSSSLTL